MKKKVDDKKELGEAVRKMLDSFLVSPDSSLYKSLNEAISHARETILNEGLLGFNRIEDYKSFLHGHLDRAVKSWKNSKICIIPSCSNRSIKKSHAISKSLHIESVSEEGHVYTPKWDFTKQKLTLQKTGVNNASTFPGFCEKHEQLFSNFEQKGKFDTPYDYYLQSLRTICREVCINTEKIRNLKELVDSNREVIKKRGTQLFWEYLQNNGIDLFDKPTIANFASTIFGDYFSYIDQMVSYMSNEITQDEKNFLLPLANGLANPSEIKKIFIFRIPVPYKLPLALSGKGNFYCQVSGTTINIPVLINILPSTISSQILLCGQFQYKNCLEVYSNFLIESPISPLIFAESWMIHGSDHWFLQPSVWENLIEEKMRKILLDIHDLSRNIGMEYEISIFDDLRRECLNKYDLPELILEKEIKKLNQNEGFSVFKDKVQ